MNLKKYLTALDGTAASIKFNSVVNATLAFGLFLLIYAQVTKDQIVALQPVTLGEEAWLSKSAASQSYMEAWGLFLAQLTGNITPENMDFVVKRVKPLLSPKIYNDMVDEMNIQAQSIKDDRVTIRFEPQSVTFEKESGKVFVTGASFMKAAGGVEDKKTRTYEYLITIHNYGPVIESASNYEGLPQTVDILNAQFKREQEAAKRAKKYE